MAYKGLFNGQACQFTEDSDTIVVPVNILELGDIVATTTVAYFRPLKKGPISWCMYEVRPFVTSTLTAGNAVLNIQFPGAVPRPATQVVYNIVSETGVGNPNKGNLTFDASGNWNIAYDTVFAADTMSFLSVSFICNCSVLA